MKQTSTTWTNYNFADTKGEIHTLPDFDLEPHIMDKKCWCVPVVSIENGIELIVHNSADKREEKEMFHSITKHLKKIKRMQSNKLKGKDENI